MNMDSGLSILKKSEKRKEQVLSLFGSTSTLKYLE